MSVDFLGRIVFSPMAIVKVRDVRCQLHTPMQDCGTLENGQSEKASMRNSRGPGKSTRRTLGVRREVYIERIEVAVAMQHVRPAAVCIRGRCARFSVALHENSATSGPVAKPTPWSVVYPRFTSPPG